MTRVLVSARSAVVRAGLEALVRQDARLELAEHHDTDLLRAIRDSAPDVVLIESASAVSSLLRSELTHQPGAPALVLLAEHLSRSEVRRALQNGVRAVLLNDSTPGEIVAAIIAAGAGLAVVSSEVLDALVPAAPALESTTTTAAGEPLTARESEVLSFLAQGRGNKEIASRLHISEHTVKFHVSSILAKLGAESRTEAVSLGYRDGLIVM